MTTTLPNSPFTVADLDRLSLQRRDLYRMIEAGDVRRISRGTYAAAHLPDTIELRAAAIALVVSEDHVVIDRSAAHIHGVDAITYAERDLRVDLETCALRGKARTRRSGVDGHVRDLLPEDIMKISGVWVTTPVRTASDLGCNLRRREAYAAMCALAREHRLSPTQIADVLRRFRRRRGVRQARELAPLVDPRFESAREAWTYLEIVDRGLAAPEPQVWIEVDGVPTFRLDLAYRHARVCVEYDGFDFHERTPEQREHDSQRRAWLRENGWTVIVVRLGDFTGERTDRWIRELRDALRPGYNNRRW